MMSDYELDQQSFAEDKKKEEKDNATKLHKYYQMAEDNFYKKEVLPKVAQNVQMTTDEDLLD
jgi:hypothetical protein